MKISDFFKTDYVDYASYDNLRKIASSIDGQKNVSRKILSTVLDKNITSEVKVSQLASKMAEHTEYLHGDSSGAIVTMAQGHVGTNNIPLIAREGNFGTRFVPEASAPRYIYTNAEDVTSTLFNKNDKEILTAQYFEGQEIEKKFYLPTLPLLLINGSEAPSTGFAQKILPRSPELITRHLKNKLQGKSTRGDVFKPYFKGFNGVINPGDEVGKWEITGVIERKSITSFIIKELPIGYSLKSYIKVLNTLEENKVITSYKDKSNNDVFHFEVRMLSSNLKGLTDYNLLDKMKLIKRMKENYTAFNEHNRIELFTTPEEIFEYYYKVKMEHLILRKKYLINVTNKDIEELNSKYIFIYNVIANKITVNGAKKPQIVKDIECIQGIIKVEGNYDYLLRMPIYSLTDEKLKELKAKVTTKRQELKVIKLTKEADMWLEELK